MVTSATEGDIIAAKPGSPHSVQQLTINPLLTEELLVQVPIHPECSNLL